VLPRTASKRLLSGSRDTGGRGIKILFVECIAEEMRANRTLIDALTDVAHNIVDAFNSQIPDELEQELKKDEEQEGEE